MKSLATTLAVTALATLVPLTACGANDDTSPSNTAPASGSTKNSTPAPVTALEKQGVTVDGKFKAPNGLTGYAATIRNHPLAIYVMPDGQHAIVGTLMGLRLAALEQGLLIRQELLAKRLGLAHCVPRRRGWRSPSAADVGCLMS